MQTIHITAPGSKSLSHRALMAAALANGKSKVTNVLESDDIERTSNILKSLGADIQKLEQGTFSVNGNSGKIFSDSSILSCFVGESGTTCRLLTAILAAGNGEFRVHGAGRMHQRPIVELTTALQELGVTVTFEEKTGCPPFTIQTSGLHPEHLKNGVLPISCDDSSQYLSGMLLAAPLGTKPLTIILGGKKAVSWPYVSLTLETLSSFGLSFSVEELNANNQWVSVDWRTVKEGIPNKIRFTVNPGVYKAHDFAVEGDWSGASYFLAAGAIGSHTVAVHGLKQDSMQGDSALIGILKQMGATVLSENDCIIVNPSSLHGVELDMGHCPDLVPTVVALAAHAKGITTITNVAHLKIKESDRLEAPALELSKVGCTVTISEDGLSVSPPPNGITLPESGVLFSAHDDHRIAMSLSLLGLSNTKGSSGFAIHLDNPGCVAKSFPTFWDEWKKITS